MSGVSSSSSSSRIHAAALLINNPLELKLELRVNLFVTVWRVMSSYSLVTLTVQLYMPKFLLQFINYFGSLFLFHLLLSFPFLFFSFVLYFSFSPFFLSLSLQFLISFYCVLLRGIGEIMGA